jgi:hypothetical protein
VNVVETPDGLIVYGPRETRVPMTGIRARSVQTYKYCPPASSIERGCAEKEATCCRGRHGQH